MVNSPLIRPYLLGGGGSFGGGILDSHDIQVFFCFKQSVQILKLPATQMTPVLIGV